MGDQGREVGDQARGVIREGVIKEGGDQGGG